MNSNKVKMNGLTFVIEGGRLCPAKENLKTIKNLTSTTKRVAMEMVKNLEEETSKTL